MTSFVVILAVLAFAMPLASCQMNMDTVAYNATVFSDDPNPGATVFYGYLNKAADTFYWNFNFTKPGVVGLKALEIRDGKKGMDILGKDLQNFTTPFSGTKSFSGNFSDGINLAVASNATELANHMCMGHIYAVVQTETASQRAVITYDPKMSGVADCYAAVGLQSHGMGDMPMDMGDMPMDMGMADAPAASNGAETVSTVLAVLVAAVVAVAA